MQAQTYIHGTSAEEHVRLSWMNQLLNERELGVIRPGGSERTLEMGAGTGLFARALAARLPQGSVLGIELDERQLRAARLEADPLGNLELRQGDVLDPPLRSDEWGRFDLVHARFLLEHLTQPGAAVATMARAVRPGGRVVLVDDDHDTLRLWPEAPAFLRVWRAYCEQYTLRGMDPWIGRRLTGLLHGAGLQPVQAEMLFFGACAGMPLFGTVVGNMAGVVEGAGADIVRTGTLAAEDLEEGLSQFEAWSREPDAALWYAVPIAVGERPA